VYTLSFAQCAICGHFFFYEVTSLKRKFPIIACFALLGLFLRVVISAPAAAQTAPTKPLTIETVYQPGGLGGRGPETVEWSPDGTKLTFVQRDEKGEKGELWYADTETGEKKVLVSAEKLAALERIQL